MVSLRMLKLKMTTKMTTKMTSEMKVSSLIWFIVIRKVPAKNH